MISASDARRLVVTNKSKQDSLLLKIETQIQIACKKGETQISYELPFAEWEEAVTDALTKVGYTVSSRDKGLTISWELVVEER